MEIKFNKTKAKILVNTLINLKNNVESLQHRINLSGIYFERDKSGGMLSLVATDGHRMSVHKIKPDSISGERKCFILDLRNGSKKTPTDCYQPPADFKVLPIFKQLLKEIGDDGLVIKVEDKVSRSMQKCSFNDFKLYVTPDDYPIWQRVMSNDGDSGTERGDYKYDYTKQDASFKVAPDEFVRRFKSKEFIAKDKGEVFINFGSGKELKKVGVTAVLSFDAKNKLHYYEEYKWGSSKEEKRLELKAEIPIKDYKGKYSQRSSIKLNPKYVKQFFDANKPDGDIIFGLKGLNDKGSWGEKVFITPETPTDEGYHISAIMPIRVI